MKKITYVLLIIFFIIISLLGINILVFKPASKSTQNNIEASEHYKSFTFETASGTVNIEADKALTPRGFAGATNYIFYIKNNNLYLFVNGIEDELYAENVLDIYYETAQAEEISVKLGNNSNIIKESSYLRYISTNKDNDSSTNVEPNNKSFTFETASGTVNIEADKALTPRGFAGATNYIFYIKNNNLYLFVNGIEDELYAENVLDIYYETAQVEEISVKLEANSNIVKESSYLKYIK